MGPNHPHYLQALELSREASKFPSRLTLFLGKVISSKVCLYSFANVYVGRVYKFTSQIASLLDCTSWSGVGPGLMDAITMGAMQAGKPVGGFKIAKEAGEWTASKFHPYLLSESYLTCR